MNRSAIRFFGIGLFLAGAAFQVHHMLNDKEITSTSAISQQSYDEAQQELTQVKQQLAALQLDLQNAQKKQATTPVVQKEEKPEKSAADGTRNMVLIIQSGMNSNDVGSLLEQSGVIQNRLDFEDYLQAQDLSSRLQIGEYELHSAMTIKQIAEIITK
ncbi:hypothetical protein MHB48_12570 [Psychrobacillus sp. FSL H8-0483]|uniref:hypothetical protein n=1 Tax=Psychrobacillus sp. FSL H8-0483 TaxID=2921389 RepID=UPI00315AAF44